VDIFAQITEIKYEVCCYSQLNIIDFQELDINLIPSNYIVKKDNFNYGI
jgi:hypothetical protein